MGTKVCILKCWGGGGLCTNNNVIRGLLFSTLLQPEYSPTIDGQPGACGIRWPWRCSHACQSISPSNGSPAVWPVVPPPASPASQSGWRLADHGQSQVEPARETCQQREGRYTAQSGNHIRRQQREWWWSLAASATTRKDWSWCHLGGTQVSLSEQGSVYLHGVKILPKQETLCAGDLNVRRVFTGDGTICRSCCHGLDGALCNTARNISPNFLPAIRGPISFVGGF